jgi:DNA-binding response OmpR family regulator
VTEAADRARTIVVIDDEQDMRTLLETLLTHAGYRVVSLGDPTQAVELVARSQPDLILCDIGMPEMNGYDVLHGLQSNPATARFPLVFLTAHREFGERIRAFRHGAVDFVSKPFTREILLRRIARVLEGLETRAGTVASLAAQELMADVRRESRSGVFTIRQPGGDAKVVVRAGEVVEGGDLTPAGAVAPAEFTELDHAREDIVPPDTEPLVQALADVPSFRELPELFRSALLVDDDDAFRETLASLLRQQGLDVIEAADGETALRHAFERRPWLIVTDTRMPGLDGFELCRRVRSHALIGQIPIVFLSGWDDYRSRYHAYELGATEYIAKGSPLRELLMRIHLLLRRYADLGPHADRGPLSGTLDLLGATGLLQLCHLSTLTGTLIVRSGISHVELRFRNGELIGAESAANSGIAALNELLGWTRGVFEFNPASVDPTLLPLGSFTHLLLEGCRLLDERRGVRDA